MSIKIAKNGQWTLEKSKENFPKRNPDGSWHPQYTKEAEDHLKNFYSHSPEAQNYLRENLWNIPSHFREAEEFKDWKVTPSHSEKTKFVTPNVKPEAHANPTLSLDDFDGHSGWKTAHEHHYQVHHNGDHVGNLSVSGDPEGGGSWSHELVNHIESHPDFKDRARQTKLMSHLVGEGFLHHVNNRIAKPKGIN